MDLELAMKNPGATFGTPEVLAGGDGSEHGTEVRDPHAVEGPAAAVADRGR